MKTILVNLLGAPGSGKSTLAADVFAKLKVKGYRCEYVDEYAKHVVYEENYRRLKNQLLVFSKQYFAMDVIRDQVNIIVTDSPLLLSIFFNVLKPASDFLKVPDKIMTDLVMYCHSTFDNMNYFIKRNHEYKQEGRCQNEEESKQYEGLIQNMLKRLDIDYELLISTDNCAEKIVADVEKQCEYYNSLKKSGLEIERKFLLSKIPENLEKCKKNNILQGYLNKNGHELRARNVDNKEFYLTEKFGLGLQREEYEKTISSTEYHNLMDKAGGRVIKKTRYYYPLEENKTAEIDFYFGNNIGLKTVEVEFDSLESAEKFQVPSWFGKEITNDANYKNSELSLKELKDCDSKENKSRIL